MPCDSRIEIRISWANANPERAQQAIDNLNIDAWFDTRTHSVVIDSYDRMTQAEKDAIMQRLNGEYAQLTIKEATEKYGWNIEGQYKAQDGSTVFNVARY